MLLTSLFCSDMKILSSCIVLQHTLVALDCSMAFVVMFILVFFLFYLKCLFFFRIVPTSLITLPEKELFLCIFVLKFDLYFLPLFPSVFHEF